MYSILYVVGLCVVIATALTKCTQMYSKHWLESKGVQFDGEWSKFPQADVWCRRAPEFSNHAEICEVRP